MAIITFYDNLGFGAKVTSATGTLLPPSLIQSDGDPAVRTVGSAFSISGSFNAGSIAYTMSGALVASNLIRIDSLTYTDAKGFVTISAGSMNLTYFPGLSTAAQALQRLLSGDDSIFGNRFADQIEGGTGNDRLYGNGGTDILWGEAGNDRLIGGDGGDTLYGGTNADTLQGGSGADLLAGGRGRDTFRFTDKTEPGLGSTTDIITDFTPGDDRIDLSLIDAFDGSRPNDTFLFRATAAFSSATAGEVRFQQFDRPGTASDATVILIDTDGDSAAEASIRLNGLYDLRASDFLL